MNDIDLSKITGNEPPTEETRSCEHCEREWFYIDNEDECPWCKVESQAAEIKRLTASALDDAGVREAVKHSTVGSKGHDCPFCKQALAALTGTKETNDGK